jgi:hypothetical protein
MARTAPGWWVTAELMPSLGALEKYLALQMGPIIVPRINCLGPEVARVSASLTTSVIEISGFVSSAGGHWCQTDLGVAWLTVGWM